MAQPQGSEDVDASGALVNTFGLDEVIAALGRDLKKAQADAETEGAFGLYFGEATVELQFTVQRTHSREGGGGLNFRVFGVGLGANAKATAGSSDETVHRIELRLVPAPPPLDDRDFGVEFDGNGASKPLGVVSLRDEDGDWY
jgi:hypothetical protein